jgi:hypothetical protein
VVARDQQAVVITTPVADLGGRTVRYRYCARDTDKFRFFLEPSPGPDGFPQNPIGPYRLRLVGGYVAYGAYWGYHGDTPHGFVTLVNVYSGQSTRSPDELGPAAPVQLLLSSTGVVAWLWTAGLYPNYTAEVRALSAHTEQTTTLDSSPSSSIFSTAPLADLRVYRCSSCCTAPSTLIAWTHSGVWRYAILS